jgi:hypothetical protein
MGMYNAVFGDGQRGYPLLSMLGFKSISEVGRYRDGWLESDGDGGYRIAIYTRNGGNNREEYMPDLSGHPYYISDKDDTVDNTYATIYFRLPPVLLEALKEQLGDHPDLVYPEPVNMDLVWARALAELESNAGYRDQVIAHIDEYVVVVDPSSEVGKTDHTKLTDVVRKLVEGEGPSEQGRPDGGKANA